MKSSIKVRADRLAELKKLHKLSDIELAKKIGVNRQTLQRAMAGENVSAAFVAGAALYFRIPFETLFQTVQAEKIAA
ncbi:helix-turn-helix domain-containing protein [Corynebacterium pseudokroppenstedtii]|uniref:helix-turn-helix domain-containing protein n=1 Tax=Corynebacterium pseudokroppenstedtii TaxID=2804917 RepID=UPI00307AC87D